MKFSSAIIDKILRYPKSCFLVSFLWVVVTGFGLTQLELNTDYKAYINERDLKEIQAMEDVYGKHMAIVMGIRVKSGNVFSKKVLADIEWVTKQAWQTPYSSRVDSIANFQHVEATEDDLVVRPLVKGAIRFSPEQVAYVEKIALSDPRLKGSLVSPSGHMAVINIETNVPGEDSIKSEEAISFVRGLKKELLVRNPDLEIYLSGSTMLSHSLYEAALHDLGTLIPLQYLLLFILLGWLLTSFAAVLITIFVLVLALISTMGAAGWFGSVLSGTSALAPIMILTLGVADCVHLLVAFFQKYYAGESRLVAIKASLKKNFRPILLTSITTAAGFLSMNFSGSPTFRGLGNIVAFGAMNLYIITLGIIPCLLFLVPLKRKQKNPKKSVGRVPISAICEFSIHHRRPLLVGSLIVTLICGFLISLNRVDENFTKLLSTKSEFRRDTDKIAQELGGIFILHYNLNSGQEEGVTEPKFLAKVSDFADWYRKQPGVSQVIAIDHTFKALNKAMHGDDPKWSILPTSKELAAQYLLLYELSLPFGLDLNSRINVNRSSTKVSVYLNDISNNEMIVLSDRADEWMDANLAGFLKKNSRPTSDAIAFAKVTKENISSMLMGTGIALVLISGLLIFAFQSLKMGLLSLIPNMVPAVLGFGIWALLEGRVGLAVSSVTGMTLGVVVDDTIHFISHYLDARRKKNMNSEDAIRHTFASVGVAMWITTLILMAGFSILCLSPFVMNSHMGIMTAIIIGCALVADYLMLPSLLLFLDREKVKAPAKASDPYLPRRVSAPQTS